MNRPLHRLFCLCLILFLIPATGQAAVFNALDVDQAQSMNEIVPVLETRVLDEAMLLSASEQIRVAQQIAAFQKNTGMDFVLLTTSVGIGDQASDVYVETFYNEGDYGLDEHCSGIAYFIDMNEGYHHLTTTGLMVDCMSDERMDYAIDMGGELLSEGRYADAVLEMLRTIETFYLQDYPEGAQQTETTSVSGTDPSATQETSISQLPSTAAVMLFLTSIVSVVTSMLTQF